MDRPVEIGHEGAEICDRRAAVDPIGGVAHNDLPHVAGRAGQADHRALGRGRVGEADGQVGRVGGVGVRQVAVTRQGVLQEGRAVVLLEGLEPGERNELRALVLAIKAGAGVGGPVCPLVENTDLGGWPANSRGQQADDRHKGPKPRPDNATPHGFSFGLRSDPFYVARRAKVTLTPPADRG